MEGSFCGCQDRGHLGKSSEKWPSWTDFRFGTLGNSLMGEKRAGKGFIYKLNQTVSQVWARSRLECFPQAELTLGLAPSSDAHGTIALAQSGSGRTRASQVAGGITSVVSSRRSDGATADASFGCMTHTRHGRPLRALYSDRYRPRRIPRRDQRPYPCRPPRAYRVRAPCACLPPYTAQLNHAISPQLLQGQRHRYVNHP